MEATERESIYTCYRPFTGYRFEIAEKDYSERTVIGGLECVSPDAFSEQIAYTALGHIHKAQRVSGRRM